MRTSPIYSRTQTRSSDRLPSNERRNILRFLREIVRKYCRQNLYIDRCHLVFERQRNTDEHWKKYKNEKLHFIHLKTYRKNTLYLLTTRKNLLKNYMYSFLLYRQRRELFYKYKSNFFKYMALPAPLCLYQTFKCPASETFCPSYFKATQRHRVNFQRFRIQSRSELRIY